jgi:hypothetical protein
VTLTPFSFLVAVPVTYFDPLTAKRIWTIANLAFFMATLAFLHSLTGMSWRRLTLLSLLWVPAHHNLQLGQMYILLLLVMTAALWCYLRNNLVWSGVLVGLAFGLKIFPILFVLYFLKKKDWRALAGVAAGCVLVILSVVAVYGLPLLVEYGNQQLPAALRGESLDPYSLVRNSPGALLHHLFIYEPDFNPAPAIDSPVLYATLHPLVQLLLFAPAFLLVTPKQSDASRTKLEWAAFLAALLVISTNTSFYQYTVLLLPAALLLSDPHLKASKVLQAALVVCLAGACFPAWQASAYDGWHALLGVPRLYFLIVLCVIPPLLLYRRRQFASSLSYALWAAILLCGGAVSIVATVEHQKHVYDDYRYRVALNPKPLLQVSPEDRAGGVQFVAMVKDGYQVREASSETPLSRHSTEDELSFTSGSNLTIVESAARESKLVSWKDRKVLAEKAFSPALSPDGHTLAFLRAAQGRGILWLKDLRSGAEEAVSDPPGGNIADLAFASDGTLTVSAIDAGHFHMLELSPERHWLQVTSGNDRYPAISPDDRWLVFSRSNGRVWNLWIQDRVSEREQRLFDVDCNQIAPSWAADSRTLLYASDCGRGLFLTALVRRRIIGAPGR